MRELTDCRLYHLQNNYRLDQARKRKSLLWRLHQVNIGNHLMHVHVAAHI